MNARNIYGDEPNALDIVDEAIALVVCLIAAMIYAGQREKLTAIYYMCISIILFLIYKNC